MIIVSRLLLTTVFAAFILSGCSTAPVQNDRLNIVENLLLDAERMLSNKSVSNSHQYAKDNIDTAGAYLLTLRDNKKVLTDVQLKRYQSLLQRESVLRKRLN